MAHSNLSHRRTHNLLLISKLLNQRDHASPLTLVLDTLEQPADPLVKEYLRRSRLSKTIAVFLSFETFVKPRDVDHFVACHGGEAGRNPQNITKQVTEILSRNRGKRHLIIIDSLTRLSSISTDPSSNLTLTSFLSSLLQPPPPPPQQQQQASIEQQPTQVSLVAVYHTDVPLPSAPTSYSPSPLSLLSYLATTVITVHSLAILLAEKSARARSLAGPTFGLREEREGVLIGLKPRSNLNPDERGSSSSSSRGGVVLELEHRRKSGRGVLEWYFLPAIPKAQQPNNNAGPQAFREIVTLLDDHPLFQRPKEESGVDSELSGMTFELGLTERQRLEREGVVLPYFDAQKAGGGGGEGGRILYDMGVEDDFDEEEDEI